MSDTKSSQTSSHTWDHGKQSSQGDASVGSGGYFWSFEDVQERLVEAMLLWKRSPGGGRWPFAGDGPWQLITRRVRMAEGMVKGMDIARLLQDDDAEEARQWLGRERRGALTRDEIARRDEASEWLRFVPERDRALVVTVLGLLAKGVKRVPWMKLKALFGVTFGAAGLARRYERAIAGVAKGLNKF